MPYYSHRVPVHALTEYLSRSHARISGGAAQGSPYCPNLKKIFLGIAFPCILQELTRLPWAYVHKCSLPMYQASPSVLPFLPTQAHDWAVKQHMCTSCSACDCIAYCKDIQIKAMEMWLNVELNSAVSTESLIGLRYSSMKKYLKCWWAMGKNLCKYCQDCVVGNTDTEACKQPDPKLCYVWRPWGCQMLTWTGASFMYYGHRIWFGLFGVILLCNYMCAGMAELWRDQFVVKYVPGTLNQ